MNRNNSTLSITGLSTGMGLHMVTPFNPNAILVKSIFPARYMVLAFARGEPLVELVANDSQTLHFFAIRFHPACEATGCNSADLLTPTIESNWTGYELFDDEALANTTLDCNTCHQPNGPGTPKILRMQERFSPWTHWFSRLSDSEFLFLFYRSHDLESTYAGAEINLDTTNPGALQFVLEDNGFVPQPNEFVSQKISDELRANGTSATWQALYANAVAGNAIPPPYFGVNQTDPNKAAAMLDAYRAVMAGTLPRDQLPDIRDVFDESALSAMSIRPKPGLDGRGILVHMCSQCHNSRLDQTLTRARFNVMALDAMSREERDTAIGRLQLADSDPAKMPPPRFRSLSDAERALVIAELSK